MQALPAVGCFVDCLTGARARLGLRGHRGGLAGNCYQAAAGNCRSAIESALSATDKTAWSQPFNRARHKTRTGAALFEHFSDSIEDST